MWHWSGAVNPGILFYENNSASLNPNFHFLTLELEGDPTLPGQFKSTRDAIGARVYVTADFDGSGVVDADETRMEEVLSGHSQAATTSSLAVEFGLGLATSADVRIVWSSGRETLLENVAANQFLQIKEQAGNADFDNDGDVDGRDFLIWQRGFGTTNANLTDGDADGDQDVDDDDGNVWAAQYGSTSPMVAALSVSDEHETSNPIPEHDELVGAAMAVAFSNQSIATINDLAIEELFQTEGDSLNSSSNLIDKLPQVRNSDNSLTKKFASEEDRFVDLALQFENFDRLLAGIFFD